MRCAVAEWHPETPDQPCPECGSDRVVPIVYGLPDGELTGAFLRGEAAIGGCLVTGDDPSRACRACGHKW